MGERQRGVEGDSEKIPFGRKVFRFAEGEEVPEIPDDKMLKFVHIRDDVVGERILAGSVTTFDHWQIVAKDPAFGDKTREEIGEASFEDAGLLIKRMGVLLVSGGSGELKVGGRPSARMTEEQQAERHEEKVAPFLERVTGEKVRVL